MACLPCVEFQITIGYHVGNYVEEFVAPIYCGNHTGNSRISGHSMLIMICNVSDYESIEPKRKPHTAENIRSVSRIELGSERNSIVRQNSDQLNPGAWVAKYFSLDQLNAAM